jgi:transmembrane sensor
MFSAAHSDDFVEALKQSFNIRTMEGSDGAVILLPDGDRAMSERKST